MKQQATPEHTIDTEGQQLTHVALTNTEERATLYTEDYQRLMDAGFTRFWNYAADGRGHAYPTLNAYTRRGDNREVNVARLIIGAGQGEHARAIDGNSLNLRRENLLLVPGTAWFGAVDWFGNTTMLRAAGLQPTADGESRSPTRRRSRRNQAAPTTLSVPLPASLARMPQVLDYAVLA